MWMDGEARGFGNIEKSWAVFLGVKVGARNLWMLTMGLAISGLAFGLAAGLIAGFWWAFTISQLIVLVLVLLVPPGAELPAGQSYLGWLLASRRFEFDTALMLVSGLILLSIGGLIGVVGIALMALAASIWILRTARDIRWQPTTRDQDER